MDFAELSSLKIDESGGEVRFAVHARPRSKRSRIEGVREGALEVALHAVPEKGAANDELVEVLSDALDVPKRSVRLVRGESSRQKTVAIAGMSAGDLRTRLGHLT